MAPTTQSLAEEASQLVKRYYSCGYGYTYSYGNCSYSSWYYWGRWVVLGVVIFIAILIFLLFACIRSRRRRRAGAMGPFNQAAWTAPPDLSHPYHPDQVPPPRYGRYEPSHETANGYYTQQQNGLEMQPPAATYQPGGEHVYAPPAGPPPAKY